MTLRSACAVALLAGALGCAARGPAPAPGAAAAPEDLLSGSALVRVEGGCFRMGAPPDDCDAATDERPVHEVCVGGFSIGRHEITRGAWRALMGGVPEGACARDDCPVVNVSPGDVDAFLAALNARSGSGRYRLPTEAEWEYAARSGGRAERYAGGGLVDRLAWYGANSAPVPHPVGAKAPNGLGLHDLSGNVWELTSDRYDAAYYARSPRDDPGGPEAGADRVVRGGSVAEGPVAQRTTARSTLSARTSGTGRSGTVGFRVVMTPSAPGDGLRAAPPSTRGSARP